MSVNVQSVAAKTSITFFQSLTTTVPQAESQMRKRNMIQELICQIWY